MAETAVENQKTADPGGKPPSGSANEALGSDYKVISVSGLRVGIKLRIPIYDENDVLLLAKGQVISPQFMTLLRQRNVCSVKVHESELPRVYAGQPQGTSRSAAPDKEIRRSDLKNDQSDTLDELIDADSMDLHKQGDPFLDELIVHGKSAYDHEFKDQVVEKQIENVKQVGEVFERLKNGKGLDVDVLSKIADDAMHGLQRDFDLFSCLGVNPYSSDYPSRHSLHVCMLAMAIGTHLKLDRPTLKELATGCLIHDAGMVKVQPVFRESRELTALEMLEVSKHPVIVFDMMKEMRVVPRRSAYIAYQMHERCDGSGYPRGRGSHQIHFLSKVAAVADCYVALATNRPHRPALHPYFAMLHVLKSVRSGKFDGLAVRALLRTISMFPLGSYVILNDERRATVIRSNDDHYTKPVVEIFDPEKAVGESEIIDLKEVGAPEIVGVADCLDA